MTDPFENPAALDKFFNDRVAVDHEGQCGTYAACVYPPALEDPISDYSSDGNRYRVALLLARRGSAAWNRLSDPQIGDIVTLASGAQFAVTSVDSFSDRHYSISARSI